MASSSSVPSSSSYQDLVGSTSLPNEFNFSYFDVPKDALFDQSNTLPLGQDPISTTNWGEALQHNGVLYLSPPNWKSPEPKVEYQSPADFSIINSVTTAQQEIALGSTIPLNYQNTSRCSPQSASSLKSCPISSPDNSGTGRKRKSMAELYDEEDDCSNPLMKKSAHNMIEKRYRTNLNDKIAALRDSVPSLRIMSKNARGEDTIDDTKDLQGLTPAHKLNKATVLSKATEYICHLEKRNKRLQQEISDQRAQLAAYETFFRSNSVDLNSSQQIVNAFQLPSDYPSPNTPSATGHRFLGQESTDIPRMRRQNYDQAYQNPSQEIYSQSQQQPMRSEGWNGHPYMGKLMIGTMAGLMIMEGYSETEQNSESSPGRGLFALPTSILRFFKFLVNLPPDIHLFGYHTSAQQILWYLKFILIFGSVLYIILPELSSDSSRTKSKRSKAQDNLLAAAQLLTSLIRARRQAWLIVVQTVRVPRYDFFLETALLCLKMAKLGIRNVFGCQVYTHLTGITKQQETAEIKAWGIAPDVQLSDGDVGVNKNHTKTLLASATLPDTPARFMLNALHIRVLFFKLGKSGFYSDYLLGSLASKLVGWKWKKAQLLQKQDAQQNNKLNSLPYHLIALLQQSSDDVLNYSIDQIAYNLAWNLPITLNAPDETDRVNPVVNDPMIQSPLDAVASLYSNLVLQRALSNSLEVKEDDPMGEKMVTDDIDIAVRIAPTGSIQHTRALVARSVLVREKRGSNIAEVMQALGQRDKNHVKNSPANPTYNSASIASLPEVEISLRCAMAIAHIERCPAPEYPEKAAQVIKHISLRNISLLGFIATFKLMERMDAHEIMASICTESLEKLAGGLRLWIGGKNGEKIGLPIEVKKEKVERCLATARRIIGM